MISPEDVRQVNINLQSATTQFDRLYRPREQRYLRGLDSFMYHRNQPAMSMAERLMKKDISPFGVTSDRIMINVPDSASDEQKMEYLYRQDALRNNRIDDGAKFQSYNSGLSTGGVNRDMVEKLNIGLIYSASKRDETRIQNLVPPLY